MKNNAWKNVAENLSGKKGRTHLVLKPSSSSFQKNKQNKGKRNNESLLLIFFFCLTVMPLCRCSHHYLMVLCHYVIMSQV